MIGRAAVKVSIHDAAGNLIELGPTKADKKFIWTYTVNQVNPNLAGSKITAVAVDLPGNYDYLRQLSALIASYSEFQIDEVNSRTKHF